MADENVSTGSSRPHYDVDDRKRPQDVVAKSELFDENIDDHEQEEDGNDNDGDGDQHDDDDLCAPMQASIHPNSISGSISELQFDIMSPW